MCGVLLMMDCDGRTREVGARRRSIRRSLPYEVMYEVPRLACARRSLLSSARHTSHFLDHSFSVRNELPASVDAVLVSVLVHIGSGDFLRPATGSETVAPGLRQKRTAGGIGCGATGTSGGGGSWRSAGRCMTSIDRLRRFCICSSMPREEAG